MAALAVLAALFLFSGLAYAAEPDFGTAHTTTITVAEDATSGTNIGDPYTATDADPSDMLSYHLSGTDASSFSIVSTSGQLQTNAALDYENKTSYSVTVGVRDSPMDSTNDATIDVTINVTNVDEAGTVTISGMPEGGQELTAAVTDLDGTVSSPTWQWARGASATGTFTDIGSATDEKYTSVADDVGKFLKATASYTDPQSATTKSANAVTASAIAASNSQPSFSNATATRDVDENTAANMDIGSAVSAIDSDMGAMLTYGLEDSGNDDDFSINTTNGRLKTKSALDHETKDTYTVTVHDGLDAASNTDTTVDATIAVTINVNDINDAPTIVSGPTSGSFDENTPTTTILATYEGSDEDTANTLSWSLDGDDAGDFTITRNSAGNGELKFKNSPNYEMAADDNGMNDYEVTVEVTDDGSPAMSATRGVTIAVDDLNEPPDITTSGTSHSEPSFEEIEFDFTGTPVLTVVTYAATDPDAGFTLTWSVSGDDAADFEITKDSNQKGVLTFKNSPDFEVPDGTGTLDPDNTYEITVNVRDSLDESGNTDIVVDDHIDVVVTVTNVDETPEITTKETTHTAPSKAEIEYDATGTPDLVVADYDGRDEENQTITWFVTGTDSGNFTMIETSGVLSFSSSPDYETPADNDTNNVYNITVEARDTASPMNIKELPVTVTVTDVNERPDIDEDFNTPQNYIEIEYDSTVLRDVHDFTATDYDDNGMDPFTWSLVGEDVDDLEIGSTSGNLTFKQDACPNDGPLPDYEEPCGGAT